MLKLGKRSVWAKKSDFILIEISINRNSKGMYGRELAVPDSTERQATE